MVLLTLAIELLSKTVPSDICGSLLIYTDNARFHTSSG